MRLPAPIFSSMLSSALSIFCQSTKHVFSPIRVNRRLPPAGLLASLGSQTAALTQKGSQVSGRPSPGSRERGDMGPLKVGAKVRARFGEEGTKASAGRKHRADPAA